MPLRSPHARRWIVRGLAIGLGGLIGLLAAEAGVRVLDPPVSRGPFPDLYHPSPNPALVYAMNPRFRGQAHGAWVRTNARGFRGPEPSHSPPGRTLRIALVGDSITFGFGLQERQTLAAGLARSLRPLLRPDLDVEILNFGVCGYNLRQELETLRAGVLPLQPDLVVLTLMSNDAERASPIAAPPRPWKRWARSQSRLWSLYEHVRWSLGEPDPARFSPAGHPLYRPLLRALEVRRDPAWDAFETALRDFGDEMAGAHRPWILAYWGAPGAFETALRRSSEAEHVPLVPLAMAYGGRVDDPAFTLGWDDHPNPRAVQAMAGTLSARVARVVPWAIEPRTPLLDRLQARLAAEEAAWARLEGQSQGRQAAAVAALPTLVRFREGQPAPPFGVLWGIEPDGTLHRDMIGRVALRGPGEVAEIRGLAARGAVLRVKVPPAEDWTDYPLDVPTFRLRLDLSPAPADRPDVATVFLRNTGPVQLQAISRIRPPLHAAAPREIPSTHPDGNRRRANRERP